ncbi:MAG: adenylate/guanylate cyclase domain-containing protein [Actinomycetes bacterium]
MTPSQGHSAIWLEQVLLGGVRRYAREQVADFTGVPLDVTRQLWRAMGFADVPDESVAFTEADVTALARLTGLVSTGLVDQELGIRMTRAMGQTLSRLAEWQVQTFVEHLEQQDGLARDEAVATSVERIGRLLPEMEALLLYVWRRQLAAAATRTLSVSDHEATARVQVVGFADLVGYTRLARGLEEHELASLVESFESRAADIVASRGARLVKTLGDEVLFVADEVEVGADTGLRLAEEMVQDPQLPDVRVGMAAGTVLSRMGDVFGTTVNLASRLTALARPGKVVVDAGFAEVVRTLPGFAVTTLWRRPVPGLGMVEPSVLSRAGAADAATEPSGEPVG